MVKPFIFILLLNLIAVNAIEMIEIEGIEPNAGPLTGDTHVMIRLKDFKESFLKDFPEPKCKFGYNRGIVNAEYIRCAPYPRKVGQPEWTHAQKTDTCIQCNDSPKALKADIIPLTVSLIGDFTDSLNSIPFRYYVKPHIDYIYPRYGPKDGNTLVEVFGKNFLNFDQNLRCGFGSREVKAIFISSTYMICYSPMSDVIQKKLPFSISLNNQQNTLEEINFVYYENPQVFKLVPYRTPDTGGETIKVKGQNFNPMVDLPAEIQNYNDTFCKFEDLGVTTEAKVISSTEIECVAPPSYELRQTEVEVTLNNRDRTDDKVLLFYYHPPFIYSIDPKIGGTDGGTTVIINGSNFEDTGIVNCRFGSVMGKGEYINENTLHCISPKVEKPGYVNLSIAIRKGEYSSGMNTKFLYYENPELDSIEMDCGPERGGTEVTLTGKNFTNTGYDKVKCIFGENNFMDATVISDSELKCNSPSVLNFEGINVNNITEYPIVITLNGKDRYGPAQTFRYYIAPKIKSITPNLGIIRGGEEVTVTGGPFKQVNACFPIIRFSTYQVKIYDMQETSLKVRSPKVNLIGAVTVQVSLNGRDFENDITIYERDVENTFIYYKEPLFTEIKPNKGPNIGGTNIKILGIGFEQPFYNVKNKNDHKVYFKFVDCDSNIDISDVYEAKVTSNFELEFETPKISSEKEVCIEVSYNKVDYIRVPNKKFMYYTLPNIVKISPNFGPLNGNSDQLINVNLDKYKCSGNDCDHLICRFSNENDVILEKAEFKEENLLACSIPRVSHPSSYKLEVSFNGGDDFTNNGFTYTFYDPYVTKVEPKIIASEGNTTIDIYGTGFADSGDNLKVRFGKNQELRCDMKDCVRKAKFIDDNHIQVETFARSIMNYTSTGKNITHNLFSVEVSVYNDDFTNNNIKISYYSEPEVYSPGSDKIFDNLPKEAKDALLRSLVQTIPANLDTMIPVPIKIDMEEEGFNRVDNFSEKSCKFTLKDDPKTFKITQGVITSFPSTSTNHNLFLCQSPIWENAGEVTVSVSLNKYDYTETGYSITMTDPLHIYKIDPPTGPREGGTVISIWGTGFENSSKFVIKFGTQNLVPMNQATFIDINKTLLVEKNEIKNAQTREIKIIAPAVPSHLETLGGLDYISVSELTTIPMDDFTTEFEMSNYIHTPIEYFYYKQPSIQSLHPHGSIVTGGTKVLVVGNWFHNNPEYQSKPYCKFGEKIVEGTFLSTVRITCISPAGEKPNVKVPFSVSMNKQDFVESDLKFTYYNDFSKAKFDKIEPSSGPDIGGTAIKLYGENITSLIDPEEFLCQFKPNEEDMLPKSVPAGFKTFEDGRTAVICNSPGGWKSGTKASILISFDGQTFIDTNFDFYFYKVTRLVPSSGPNLGGGYISVVGSGFLESDKVKCKLGEIISKPELISEKEIRCPLLKAPKDNFTGTVDFGISLNGIDWKDFEQGFYYYNQPILNDVYPRNGPANSETLVKVFGSGFKDQFVGADPACKVGSIHAKATVISETEMHCQFDSIPSIKNNKSNSISIALNDYSFTPDQENLRFFAYGIESIQPASGPLEGQTDITVKGNGFVKNDNAKCRFGVTGYFAYTTASYLDESTIVCSSPSNFNIPNGGEVPFSVPFSISFNDEEFSKFLIRTLDRHDSFLLVLQPTRIDQE